MSGWLQRLDDAVARWFESPAAVWLIVFLAVVAIVLCVSVPVIVLVRA